MLDFLPSSLSSSCIPVPDFRLPFLEKAAVLRPDDIATWRALTEIYFRTGDLTQAKTAREKIKSLTR